MVLFHGTDSGGITPRHTYTFSPFLSLFLPLCNPSHYPGSWAKKIWTKSPEQLVSVRGPCQNTNTNLLLLLSHCVCKAGKGSRQVFQHGSFRAQMNTSYEAFRLHNPTSQQQLGLKASARVSSYFSQCKENQGIVTENNITYSTLSPLISGYIIQQIS